MSLGIKQKLLNKQLPIQHRFFNILTLLYVIIGLIGFGVGQALDVSYIVSGGISFFILINLLFCVVVNITKNYNLWTGVLYVLMNSLIMPVSYFYMGGHRIGLDVWIVASIIMGVLILSRKVMYALLALDAVVYTVMFIVAYYKPEFISQAPSDKLAVVITAASVGIGALGISLLLLYQRDQYEQQLHLNQVREAELERLIHELKTAKEEAENGNASKTRFLINMSEEIAAPLNVISDTTHELSVKTKREDIRDSVANLYAAGNMISSLVGDIVDLSRIESGDFRIEQEVYNLREVIQETYNITKPRADRKALGFRMEADPEIPEILVGDRDRIRQVILNILSKSIQTTPVGEIVYKVHSEQENDQSIRLVIEVTDTGIGVKQEEMEGTVTDLILRLMGSQLKIDSEYGQGTCYAFELKQQVEDWKVSTRNQQESEVLTDGYQEQIAADVLEIKEGLEEELKNGQ